MMSKDRLSGCWLLAAAATFWNSWLLMPGVGVTDAATILSLVGENPQRVLASSILQLASAAFFALAIPGLVVRFWRNGSRSGNIAILLLAVGACGDAADAIYHQLAYEMVRPGVDRLAMLPVMQRMQTIDLLFLMPLVLAFFAGAVTLSLSASRLRMVGPLNPILYLLGIAVVVGAPAAGIPGRIAGLTLLGCLSLSLAGVALAVMKGPSGTNQA